MRTIIQLLSVAALFLGLACLSPAPIRDPNVKVHALQPQDEKTLEAEQRAGPVVKAQVGGPTDGGPALVAPVAASDQGKSVVLAASQHATDADRKQANQVLAAASSRMQPAKSEWWPWALGIAGGAFAIVFGVKRWADAAIPAPPTAQAKSRPE